MEKVCERINTQQLDSYFEQAQLGTIWNDIFFFYYDLASLVTESRFHLFDGESLAAVAAFFNAWSRSLDFGEAFEMLPDPPFRYKFRGSNDTWERFTDAVNDALNAYQRLISLVKVKYSAIDLSQTDEVAYGRNKKHLEESRQIP